MPKLDDIKLLLNKIQTVTILGICETFLNELVDDSLLHIEGFDFERKDGQWKSGGGVMLYISNMYKYKRRSDIESKTVERIWIDVFPPHSKSFLLCSVYRPPPHPPTGLTTLRNSLTMQRTVTT